MINKRAKWSADIVNFSMLSYMLWLLLPSVQAFTHAVTGVVTIIVFGIGVLLDGVTFRRDWLTFIPRVLITAAQPLILILFLDRGGSAKAGFYVQQCMFWFPLIWYAYARMQNNLHIYRWVFPAFLILVGITTITTIVWQLNYFMINGLSYSYSRLLGFDGAQLLDERILAMQRNIGGYNFIYMSVLFLPIIAHEVIANSGWRRVFMLSFYGLLLAMIVMSLYSYAIILALVITSVELLSALLRKIFRSLSVTVSFLLTLPFFLLLFLLRHPLIAWALQIATHFGINSVIRSLQSLLNMINGDTTSMSRLYYYKLSLDGFLSSPWLGSILNPDIIIGMHSELLDLLASIGLIGTAGFIGGVWVIGRNAATGVFRISKKTQPHLWLQWLIFCILLTVNTVFYSREIPLVLCLSIAYFMQEDHRFIPNKLTNDINP